MQHTALSYADHRKVLKDWVMRQDDDRMQVFHDPRACVVGQFLNEHPEFRALPYEQTYSMSSSPNMWNSTHSDTYYDHVTEEMHTASEALMHGTNRVDPRSPFSLIKEGMSEHPLWAHL